jgi:serine/threonine protein kinase
MTPDQGSSCTRCGTRIGPGAFFCPRCGTSIPVSAAPQGWAAPTVAGPSAGAETLAAARDAQLEVLRRAALGQYEILTELGRGGMATVYLGHDLALERKVAIKVLAPALLVMGEGMVERFKREARTAAALSHPHIIPIFAVRESEHVLYFVMKYVKGRPLDVIIREVGALPIAMIQTILAQVSDALGYAHRHGVVHRDIKSANIMLDEEGWAVVTDFGIAKVVQAEGLTMTGVTVGTPTYMSPEQCAREEITGASDQYSLGVVAYEMLTGSPPFQDDSIMSVMYAHFNEPPRPVTELRPDCPPNLAAGVMRMLEKNPAQRWPSMDDVVAVCGRPSLRHDDPIRRDMITLARPSAAQSVAVNTPTSPIAWANLRTSESTRRRRARNRRRWLWGGGGVAAALVGAGLLWSTFWRQPTQPVEPPLAAPPPAPDTAVPAAVVPRPESTVAAPAPLQAPNRTVASASRGAAQRDDSLIRALRGSALQAQQRAADVGASPIDLGKGSIAFRAGESLASARRIPEAMMQFATAASLWGDAERQARLRPAPDSSRRVAEQPPPPPALLPAPQPAAALPTPVDPAVEIRRIVDEYARALESGDLDRVRRAYPGLTAAQQASWRDFFNRVRNLRASLGATQLSVDGTTAHAVVSGTYEYDNASTNRAERRPVTFQATFTKDTTGWRLATIR